MAAVPPLLSPAGLVLWPPAGALLGIGWYTYGFLDETGMYSNIMSWQLTIWALHATPIMALRLLALPRPCELLACGCWTLLAWRCRRWQRSIFSLLFLAVEAVAALVELGPRLLAAMCALQAIIATVAWGGMLAASCSATVTFVPMDRHLRLGSRHLFGSPAALRCLAHELLSHFIAQALFGSCLLWGLLETIEEGAPLFPPTHVLLCDLAGAICVYVVIVLAAAMSLAPHELPYNLGALPKALQMPVSLPDWLRGDGAVAGTEHLHLPWWMQVPEEEKPKEQ